MKHDRRKLIRKALEHHAPLSDAQLCWLLAHFEMKPATTRRLRYEMTKRGEVRFARKTYRTGRGQMVCTWELSPVPRKGVERCT
jgi:hypothetical protein